MGFKWGSASGLPGSTVLSIIGATIVAVATAACGGGSDAKVIPESNDEYTEPLTNAVVSTPAGTMLIGPTGAVEDAGSGSFGGSSSGSVGGDAGSFEGDDASVSETEGGTNGGGGFGQWHFDDCSPTSPFLLDSSGFNDNAQHAVGASCVAGASGLAVQFRSAKDVVEVPDQPQFTVGSRVAVAAWVNPVDVSGDQPIVIKRLNDKTSFSLGIHNGNIQMAVVLTTGTTYISSAPIPAGVWSHVAGMFDGTFVFLFVDGQPFGQVYAAGTLRDVVAPIRIGATSKTQFFHGIIDEVFVSTEIVSASTLTALACISKPSTLAVTPALGGPVPFDTSVHFDVAVTDNDFGFCSPKSYEFFTNPTDSTVSAISDSPQFVSNVQQGATAAFGGADVSVSDDGVPGIHQVPFEVFDVGTTNFESLNGQLTIDISTPTGCFVKTPQELMLADTSIVDDPARTFGVFTPSFGGGFGDDGGIVSDDGGTVFPVESDASVEPFGASAVGAGPPPPPTNGEAGSPVGSDAGAASAGVWTFGHFMKNLAPTEAQAPAMTLKLFQHWLTDQTVNGFTVAARPAIQQVLLDIWPKTAAGALDLDQPPLTLQAIVNRIDLRNLAAGSAGEVRFVFAVNGAGFPQSFTVILEYTMPAKTEKDVLAWAKRWHNLSMYPFPSEQYNAALEAITDRITNRNANSAGINGSNLVQLRTNEIALSDQWELRSFSLSAASKGFFQETTDSDTPDLSFNGTQAFADFVNQNASAIIAVVPGAMAGLVPATFEGQAFNAGSVFNNQIEWFANGIVNSEARFHASMNTCNGCHGPETGTPNFTMITPRSAGTVATLSPFLTGTVVTDEFSGEVRTLNDLERRRTDLTGLVCGTDGGAPPGADAGSPPPLDGGASAPASDAGPTEK